MTDEITERDTDLSIRKIVYLKQEAAIAQLALEKACTLCGLDLDELINTVISEENALIARMQKLQLEASQDASRVTGLSIETHVNSKF